MPALPIKRHGGKHYLAAKHRKLFPPHLRYCEPYFGSGAALFTSTGEGVQEYANDLDYELINFWTTLQSEQTWKLLLRRCTLSGFGEPIFRRACESKSTDPITRAANFFIRNRQSRQALEKDFVTPTSRLRNGINEHISAWLGAIDGMPYFHARLSTVEIRNQPALDFILQLDSSSTFFYCDPPYLHTTRTATDAYQYEMTYQDHEQLLTILASIQGKFMLCGYPSELYDGYRNLYRWDHRDFPTANASSSYATKEIKIERIWTNYTLSA